MQYQRKMYETIWKLVPCIGHSSELIREIGKISVDHKTFRIRKAEALLKLSLKSNFGPDLSDYQLSCFNECQSAALEVLS